MILPLLFGLATLTYAQASVQSVCGLDRPNLSTVNNLSDLNQSLCSLPGIQEDNELQNLTSDTRSIIQNLSRQRDDDENPLENKALIKKLNSIADILSNRRAPANFSPERQDPVSASMTTLFTIYGSEAARKQNPQGYYQAMREVLSKTTQGARVLECFERTEPRVRGSSVEFFDETNKPTSMAATFQTRYNENEHDYSKVITLSASYDPALSLTLLGHELQHSCDMQNSMRLQDEYRDLEARKDRILEHGSQEEIDAAMDAIEAKNYETNRADAIDELRAYRMMPELFSELAIYHPAFFCQQYGAGTLFGRQVQNTGEFMSTLETKIHDGSFINTLIDSYTQGGGYDLSSFYETDPATTDWRRDAQGNMILNQDTRRLMTEARFNVPH